MLPVPLVGFLLLQTVWVVDDSGGPGVDFTDIPPAIAAAADGDAILVAPGGYSHFVLTGKGLRVLGSGNQSSFVGLSGPAGYTTQVSGVPAGHVVDLRGLNFGWPFTATGGDRLVVTGASTQVVLADSIVVGSTNDTGAHSALRVEDAEVQVHRSTVTSLNLPFPALTIGNVGGIALAIRGGARVHVSSSAVRGGHGGPGGSLGGPPPGGTAIDAAETSGGTPWLWVADSVVRGGAGGTALAPTIVTGTGGVGIAATNAHVRVSGDSTSLVQGGASPTPSVLGSGPGPGITASGAYPVEIHSVAVLSGCAASPACTTPATVGPVVTGLPPLPVLRASGTFSLAADGTLELSNGPSSAPFALVLDEGPSHFGIPGPFLGEFVTGPPPAVLLHFGTLGSAGSSSLTIPLAGLPPSLAYTPFHVQGAALDAGGVWRLSNGTVVVLQP